MRMESARFSETSKQDDYHTLCKNTEGSTFVFAVGGHGPYLLLARMTHICYWHAWPIFAIGTPGPCLLLARMAHTCYWHAWPSHFYARPISVQVAVTPVNVQWHTVFSDKFAR
jgi:hypothetical protein